MRFARFIQAWPQKDHPVFINPHLVAAVQDDVQGMQECTIYTSHGHYQVHSNAAGVVSILEALTQDDMKITCTNMPK